MSYTTDSGDPTLHSLTVQIKLQNKLMTKLTLGITEKHEVKNMILFKEYNSNYMCKLHIEFLFFIASSIYLFLANVSQE